MLAYKYNGAILVSHLAINGDELAIERLVLTKKVHYRIKAGYLLNH